MAGIQQSLLSVLGQAATLGKVSQIHREQVKQTEEQVKQTEAQQVRTEFAADTPSGAFTVKGGKAGKTIYQDTRTPQERYKAAMERVRARREEQEMRKMGIRPVEEVWKDIK